MLEFIEGLLNTFTQFHLSPNKEDDGMFKLANVEQGFAFHQHGSHVFLIEIQCHVSSRQGWVPVQAQQVAPGQ